jgi:hypothetical protein
MKTLKLFSAAVVLIMLICVKGFAQDGDDKVVGKATARAEQLRSEYSLSDAQYKSVYDLFVSTIQKENALWTSGKSRMEMEESKDQIHQDFVSGIKSIFTAEQYTKFDTPQTESGIEEGAKWRAIKMQKSLNLTEEQRKFIYDLIVSSTKKQNELNASAKDKTALYEGRIKINDEFYASVKGILTADQFEKFNMSDY